MKVSVCVGEYAKTSYCVPGQNLEVFSMEELCYCLKENAFLIDLSIMDDKLVKWIDTECGLAELARELYPLVHKQGSLSAFVSLIMDYVGLYPVEVTRRTEQILKQGAGLDSFEKKKSQIDYLVGKKKYALALQQYDLLLERYEGAPQSEAPSKEALSAVYFNKGVAYTRMMLYDKAADMFMKAFEMTEDESSYAAFLAAKRMELSESEYVAFAAGLSGRYEQTLRLEKRMEELVVGWQEQVEYLRLAERTAWRTGNESQKYYDDNDKITQALKSGYRNSTAE